MPLLAMDDDTNNVWRRMRLLSRHCSGRQGQGILCILAGKAVLPSALSVNLSFMSSTFHCPKLSTLEVGTRKLHVHLGFQLCSHRA